MRLIILFGLVGLLLTGALSVTPGWADGEEISVLEQRAENRFPDGVKFFVEAQGPDEIEDIRVFFKKIGQTNRSAYRSVEFKPGTSIKGESMIRSGGNEYIPPGTRIAFSFELRDSAGRVRRTEEQIIVYLDERFEWQTMSEGMVTVYYQGSREQEAAGIVLESASAALQRMGPVLGISPTDPLHIVTYGNYAHMAEALPFRSRATEQQLITQGMAFTEERVLLVHSFDSSVRGTSSHEFTHLLVADAVGRAITQVPSWLNEGLAEYANVEPSGSYESYLRQAIARGTLRPLRYQGTFSGSPEDIIVGYGQASSVVHYLVDTYGPEKMAELMLAVKRTLDIDEALLQVYGFDQHGLDTEWRTLLGLEPFPSPEELDSQRAELQPTPMPETVTSPAVPAPTDAPAPEQRLEQAPDSPPAVAPAPTVAPVSPSTADEPVEPRATPGCAAPNHGASVPGELATLLLLAAPFGLLLVHPRGRRNNP
ncbi:MAG: peptidase MA family metallohydrolase [Dehalococcoidia bacterium]